MLETGSEPDATADSGARSAQLAELDARVRTRAHSGVRCRWCRVAWTPIAVAVALILAGIYLSYSRLFGALEHDSDALIDYVTRIVRGRGGNVERYRLSMFQQIAVAASRYARRVAPEGDRPRAPLHASRRRPNRCQGRSRSRCRTSQRYPQPEDEETDEDFLDVRQRHTGRRQLRHRGFRRRLPGRDGSEARSADIPRVRHSRHRHDQSHRERRVLDRPRVRGGGQTIQTTTRGGRLRRAPVEPRAQEIPRARTHRRRHRRDGHRRRADTAPVLRDARARHRDRDHDHRVAQSARIQRPEDDARRRNAGRRAHHAASRTHRRKRAQRRGGRLRRDADRRSLHRSRAQRRRRRATAEGRRRLRQRRCRRRGAAPHFGAGLRSRAALLRRRRQFPEPPSRSRGSRKPAGPDHRRQSGEGRHRACVRRRRRPARCHFRTTATSSGPTSC